MAQHSIDQLKRAVAISEQIQKLEAELVSALGGSPSAATPAAAKPAVVKSVKKKKKGKMSAEGRARIVAALKARWAKIKGDKEATPTPAPKAKAKAKAKAKRFVSPEARAKMAAAQRARWAKPKA